MPQPKKVKVALIGSGDISGTYLPNMIEKFSILDVVGCSDIIEERSCQRAQQFGIRQMTNQEIFTDPTIEIIVNTTYPLAHYDVSRQAMEAGKNVVSEKMMAVTLGKGDALMQLARQKGVRFGMAPDTFLSGSAQTARKLLDAGMIGTPFAAKAVIIRGYKLDGENGTDYAFTQQPGGGIPFDMGGYYLHGLMNLLGPVRRVTGFCQTRQADRPYYNPRNPLYGEMFHVDTPNMLSGALEFESGVYASVLFASEGFGETSELVIYGTEGTLVCGNPNDFDGPVYVQRIGSREMVEMPVTHGYTQESRGLGVADMAWAMRNGRPHRNDAAMGYHAFECVHGIWLASQTGQSYTMHSTMQRPAPLPSGYVSGSVQEQALAL